MKRNKIKALFWGCLFFKTHLFNLVPFRSKSLWGSLSLSLCLSLVKRKTWCKVEGWRYCWANSGGGRGPITRLTSRYQLPGRGKPQTAKMESQRQRQKGIKYLAEQFKKFTEWDVFRSINTYKSIYRMGSSSSKFKKYLQHGDEFAAMQVTPHFMQATSVFTWRPFLYM